MEFKLSKDVTSSFTFVLSRGEVERIVAAHCLRQALSSPVNLMGRKMKVDFSEFSDKSVELVVTIPGTVTPKNYPYPSDEFYEVVSRAVDFDK